MAAKLSLLILFVSACGYQGPLVFGPELPAIDIGAQETEDYFAEKGLEPGWTAHQVIYVKTQKEIDEICPPNSRGCSTTPWHSFISLSTPSIKQITKHELGHQGFFRLERDVDANHKKHLDFWDVIQFQ